MNPASPRKANCSDEPEAGEQLVRITDLRVHSIAITDPPLRSSYGLHYPYALRPILDELDRSERLGP